MSNLNSGIKSFGIGSSWLESQYAPATWLSLAVLSISADSKNIKIQTDKDRPSKEAGERIEGLSIINTMAAEPVLGSRMA
jgi:hypothetical protein